MEKKQITADEALQRGALNAAEFAELFGVSRITTYRNMEAGKIPSMRIGGRVMVPRSYYASMIEVQK